MEELLQAVEDGNIDIVSGMISDGININLQDIRGYTALMIASRNGYDNIVDLLIKSKANINLQNDAGSSALIFASARGNDKVVDLLLKAGANINLYDKNEQTALILASQMGRYKVVELLVKAGSKIDLQDNKGNTALMLSFTNGKYKVLDLLIKSGANVNLQNKNEETALMIATGQDYDKVVDLLIKAKANINLQDNEGNTPLIIASAQGYNEIIDLLLNAKANINLQDKDGNTSLIYASRNGYDNIVDSLIKAGAKIDLQDNEGKTALIYASRNGYDNIVDLLIKTGAKIDLQDKDGKTSLMVSSDNGRDKVIELLIKAGAKINLQDKDGKTALMVVFNDDKIADLLIKAGAKIDLEDKNGDISFITTSRNGRYKVVDYLLQAGVKIDFKNRNGDTALMVASENGRDKVIDLLLNLGAKIDLQNNNGETALMIASRKGYDNIFETLIKAGANINLRDKNGDTANMIAYKYDKYNITKNLEGGDKKIIKYNTDICKISPYVKQIKGFNSNSASPTDTWVVLFKDNVYYENLDKTEDPIKSAFIKLFISTDFVSYPETEALEYEIKTYRDIIRPLIDYNICNNFIKYLSSGFNCTYNDLKNMLENHLFDSDENIILPEISEKLLKRNLNCIEEACNPRMAINTEDKNDRFWEENSEKALNFKIDMIMNEQIPANTTPLYVYFDKTDINTLKKNIFIILFQIAYACYSLFLSKVTHNDLHIGNIFIHTHPTKTVMYVVNGNVYKFDTNNTIYIYDFDRSYSERLGENKLLLDNCKYGSQCNYIISAGNKDFIKSLCYIQKQLKGKFETQDLREDILELVGSNTLKMRETYNIDCFFSDLLRQMDEPLEGAIYEEEFFNNGLYNIEEIVNNIGQKLIESDLTVSNKDIFMIRKDYFSIIGELDINKVKNDRKEFLNKVSEQDLQLILRPSSKPVFDRVPVKERPVSVIPLSVRERPLSDRVPVSIKERPVSVIPPSVRERPLSDRVPVSIKERPAFIRELSKPPVSSKYFKIPKGLIATKSYNRFVPRSETLRKIILSEYKDKSRKRSRKSRRKSCKRSKRIRKSRKRSKKSKKRSRKSRKRSRK